MGCMYVDDEVVLMSKWERAWVFGVDSSCSLERFSIQCLLGKVYDVNHKQ